MMACAAMGASVAAVGARGAQAESAAAEWSTVASEAESTAVSSAHTDKWKYSAEGAVLTATCTSSTHDEARDGARTVTATLDAPAQVPYTGEAFEVSVKIEGAEEFPGELIIDYWYSLDDPSDYTWSMGPAVARGYYRVEMFVLEDTADPPATAYVEFQITNGISTIKIESATVEYGDEIYDAKMVFSGADENVLEKLEKARENQEIKFDFGGYTVGAEVAESGRFDVTAEPLELGNQTVVFEGCKLTILPREIALTLTFREGTYGDDPGEWVSVKAFHENRWYVGDKDDISILKLSYYSAQGLAFAPSATTPAGEYAVGVKCGNENYKVWDIRYEGRDAYTVARRGLKAKIALPEDLTYGNVGTFSATLEGIVNGDAVTALLHFGGTTNGNVALPEGTEKPALAGTYTVKAAALEGTGADNYTLAADGERGFTIERAKLTVTAKDRTICYGDEAADGGVEYAGFVNGEGEDALGGALEYTFGGYKKFANAGDYDIVPQGLASDNYEFDYRRGTLKVEPLKVGVTWTAGEYEYSGAALALPEAFADGVNGERFTLVVTVFAHPAWGADNAFTVAGDYTLAAAFDPADGARSKNYTLDMGTAKFAVTVSKKRVTAAWEGRTYTYRGEEIPEEEYPAATADGGRAVLAVAIKGGGQFRNAGKYTFTAALTDADGHNYELTGNLEREYEIGRARLVVEWSGSDVQYTYSYANGGIATPRASAKGEGTDGTIIFDVEMTSPGGEFLNVGRYAFRATVAEGDREKAANYDIAGETREYAIVRAKNGWEKALAIQSWTYGESANAPTATPYFGKVTFTYSADGEGSFTGTAPTAAGTYYVRASVEGNENYEGIEATREFTVNRAPLRASLSARVVYGDEMDESNVTVTIADGLQYDDRRADIERAAKEKVGAAFKFNYTAGVTGAGAMDAMVSADAVELDNYKVTFIDGKVDVEKRKIRVTLKGARTNTYGDAVHGEIEADATRADSAGNWYATDADRAGLNGQLAYTFQKGTDGGREYDARMAAGEYTVIVQWAGGSALARNYQIVGADGTAYTVERKPLAVTVTAEVVYGDEIGAENVRLAVRTGLVGGDDAAEVLAAARAAASFDFGGYAAGATKVGRYRMTAAAQGEIPNYAVLYESAEGNLNVTPRRIRVTLGGALQHVYGDTPARPILRAVRVDGEGNEVIGAAWYGSAADAEALERGAEYALKWAGGSRALDAGAPAGDYTVELVWADDNYIVEAESAAYRVERASLTVLLAARVTYGEEVGADNVRVTVADENQLKNGDKRADIEGAAKAAATFDFGGYKAGMSALRRDITVNARGMTENYAISYMGCTLVIERREITAKADMVRTVYTGRGQGVSVTFGNLYYGDALALGDDYTVKYSPDGAAFGGLLPCDAGRYLAEVALSSSQTAANYTIVGERQFGYEILPAAIAEDFTRGFEKSRSALYSADDRAAQSLELPAQGDAAFPLILRGNDNGIVNKVALRYIVLSHAEGGALHEEFRKKIEGYLALLCAGAEELEGVGYSDRAAPAREPGWYCVFFEAKAPNHATYYGYYTLHIYHERLIIKMAEGGLDFTCEYGDVPHTYSSLFDLVFERIESITATAEDGTLSENKKAQFKAEKDYFQFYFTDAAGGREYAIGDPLAANATYALHVRYAKPNAADEESGYIEFVWEGGSAPTMTVSPRALILTLGGSRTHVYGESEFGSILPRVACKNAPENNTVNEEGLFGKDTVEGLGLGFTFARDGQTGLSLDERMDVGQYSVAVTCANENYTIVQVGGAIYTVTPRPLTVDLFAEVVYGDALGRGNVGAKIAGGLTPWEDAEAMTAAVLAAGEYVFDGYAQGGTHAGERGATVRAERRAVGNYDVFYTAGDVTVTPREIKVTLTGARTNVYGDGRHGEIAASAVRVGGGVWYGNPDDALDFSYRFRSGSGAAAEYFSAMEAGEYTIVIVWESGDYRIVGEPEGARYTVTRANIVYETPSGGQYSGAARELLETLEGVAGETLRRGEDYDVFYGGVKYDGVDQRLLPKDAGTYDVRLELKGRAKRNYTLGRESFSYTIARVELERPTGDRTIVYDGEEHLFEASGFDFATMSASGDGVDRKSASLTARNAGVYPMRVALRDLINYCWAGGAQDELTVTFTISAADIEENEKFAALKDREFLYHTGGERHDLALPDQSSAEFPFTVPGGDVVKVSYIVTEHAESAHDEGAIVAFFKALKRGEHADMWHAANADMYVNTPKGYCVYIRIEGANHNTYYGYYTVHIYHEEITIRLDESIVDGHFHNVEYGDAAHTQDVLRDRLYAHIREVVAGAAGDEGTMLGERLNKRYFTFYLIDELGVTHELGETDNGDRLPVGVYRIGVRYLKDGEESHYIRFRWYGDVQPDFEIVPRKIDLTLSFEGHTYGATPLPLAEQVTLSAVRSGGVEGAWYGKRGETFADLGLSYSLRKGSGGVLLDARMAAGGYAVQVVWENPNYLITLVSAEYTVSPRTLAADFGAFDGLVYGGANDPAARLAEGVLWDDEVEISILSYAGVANGGAAFAGGELPTLAGDYTVTVALVGAESGNYTLAAFEYAFTIGRAVYDMGEADFADGVFRWDGSAHSLAATGLPAGVWAHYTGNGRTEPGVYAVVAYFEGDFDNYMEIPSRSATLTILRVQMQSHLEGEQGEAPDVIVESAAGLDPTLELRMRQSAKALGSVMVAGGAFGGGLAKAYDIDFYKDGARVATSERVTVRLLIPEELRGNGFGVFSVRGEGENMEIVAIDYTVEGDYIVITMDGLSTIAFTYANTPLMTPIGLAAAALVLGVAVMALEIRAIKEKKKRRSR